MRVAIVGSRCIEKVNLEEYLPEDVTEIISGGAKGMDSCARAYAREHGIEASPHNGCFGALRSISRQIVRSFLEIRQDYGEICEQSERKISSQFALVPLCDEALS